MMYVTWRWALSLLPSLPRHGGSRKGIAAVLGLALAFVGGQAWAQTVDHLKVALVSRTVFYAPLWVAHQKKLFEKENLKVELEIFDNAERISDALKAGSVQIAISTPEGAIIDSLKGGPLRIVGGNAKRLPHFVIAKPSVKKPEDLRGANFGVLSLNEGTSYLVREYAKSIGLKPDEYRISQVGGAPTRWKLLQEGKIDAGLQPFPLSYEAERAGFTNLGPISRMIPEWQFTSVNVNDNWARENRRVVERFLRALQRGSSEMERDIAGATAIVAHELRTSPELAKRALDDTQSLDILTKDWSISHNGLKVVFESLLQTGQVPQGTKFDLAKVIDESYLVNVRPLAVRDVGSFFVGGSEVELAGLPTKELKYAPTAAPITVNPNGTYSAGQVYVQYTQLASPESRFPILFLNGGTSTGAMWESTPDGRPGWQMFFLRRGYDVYLTDAIGKGRASWARFPEVFKVEPTFRPNEETWKLVRIGLKSDKANSPTNAYADTQFPVQAFANFSKQTVPRFAGQDAIELAAYSKLIEQIGPCIVIAQSSGINFALQLALKHPGAIKAIAGIEPTAFPATSANGDLARLQQLPQFYIWGDHLQEFPLWRNIKEHADTYGRALGEKSNLKVVDLPGLGIYGNTHQMMMDRNSDEIAGMVADWLEKL